MPGCHGKDFPKISGKLFTNFLNYLLYEKHYIETFLLHKVSKYGAFSGPKAGKYRPGYLAVFRPNTGKNRPAKSLCLDTFYTVFNILFLSNI